MYLHIWNMAGRRYKWKKERGEQINKKNKRGTEEMQRERERGRRGREGKRERDTCTSFVICDSPAPPPPPPPPPPSLSCRLSHPHHFIPPSAQPLSPLSVTPLRLLHRLLLLPLFVLLLRRLSLLFYFNSPSPTCSSREVVQL